MSDPTAARDRAIARLWDEAERAEQEGRPARVAPADLGEVLRALAGAPTADVASPSKFREMARVIDEVIAHYHQYNELDVPWLAETARRLRTMTAAPEGVDAADELARWREKEEAALLALSHTTRSRDEAEKRVRDLKAVMAPVVEAWNELSDEPTGDPAFKVELIARLNELARMYVGMDLEAQGGLADELTAAQAAIQRVRDLADKLVVGRGIYTGRAILRALNGDTTEEQR